jgi:hypothetical protein
VSDDKVTAKRTLLAWDAPNGLAQMSPTGFALLVGAPVEDVEAVWNPTVNQPLSMRPEWIETGKQRTAKARAATGADSLGPVLAWLAATDLGCACDVDAGRQLWLITPSGGSSPRCARPHLAGKGGRLSPREKNKPRGGW